MTAKSGIWAISWSTEENGLHYNIRKEGFSSQYPNRVRDDYFSIYWAAVGPSLLFLKPLLVLLYQPWMMDGDDCGAISEMNEWQGKTMYQKEPCLSATLSTINPT
jgi:hypothetical protein